MQAGGVHDLRPGKPPEDWLDGGEGNEGDQGFGKVLEVLGETPVAYEPGEVRSTAQRHGTSRNRLLGQALRSTSSRKRDWGQPLR